MIVYIIGILSLLLLGGIFWIMQLYKKQGIQEATETTLTESANAKTKEAAIFAKPKPDTWADTVDGL